MCLNCEVRKQLGDKFIRKVVDYLYCSSKRGKRREGERKTSSPRGTRLSERRRSVRQADSGAGDEVLVFLTSGSRHSER